MTTTDTAEPDRHDAQTVPTPQDAPELATRGKFTIPGDAVMRATADLPDDQRSAIRWLHAHACEQSLGLQDLARILRYDATTLHRMFHGRYEGSVANLVAEIKSYRTLHEQRRQSGKVPFIKTALSKRLWSVFDLTLEFQRMTFVVGESQIGKTVNALAYQAEHNHGSTIYVRMPTGGGLVNFEASLAAALNIRTQSKERELRRRVISAFDDRTLLIVDEAHQSLRGKTAHTIEWIREIHDVSGCGVVIMATNALRDEMKTGDLAALLRQSARRRLFIVQLPDSPTRADLNAFAAHYGLPPAKDDAERLQAEVIREEALGVWLTLLRMAKKLATGRSQTMDWSHVLKAHYGRRALESGAV